MMRDRLGSVTAVAEAMGLSLGHVARVLNGERKPGWEMWRGAYNAFPEERPVLRRMLFTMAFGEDGCED